MGVPTRIIHPRFCRTIIQIRLHLCHGAVLRRLTPATHQHHDKEEQEHAGHTHLFLLNWQSWIGIDCFTVGIGVTARYTPTIMIGVVIASHRIHRTLNGCCVTLVPPSHSPSWQVWQASNLHAGDRIVSHPTRLSAHPSTLPFTGSPSTSFSTDPRLE